MPPIPPRVVEIADDIGFGEVELARRQAWVPTVWISLTMCLGLGVLFVAAATQVPTLAGILGLGGFGAFWLAAAGYGLWDAGRMARRRFYLCEGGLLIAERVTRPVRIIAWSEVAAVRRYYTAVYSEAGRETFHRCRLRLSDGTRVNLERPPLSDGDDLCAAVEERVTAARLPGTADALARGETVAFGPIAATRDGLTHHGRRLPWEQIGVVTPRRVRVRFLPRDGSRGISVRVRDVDNLLVLLAIAERHRIRIIA